MAEKQDADQEPSIEEILDSIRQIISDDDEAAGAEAAPAESAAEPESDPDDDIVELTEKVEEPAMDIDMQEAEEPAAAPAPAVPKPPPPAPEPKPAAAPPAPAVPKENPELPPGDSDSILTEKAENAAMEAFTDLARRAAVETSGQVTIEDIVRQEMRPMLRAWMDKHLPSMVERLVQKELERIARQAESD